MTKLQFHGVAYDSASHEQPSGNPVQHTYRGQRFDAPLRHDAAPVQPTKLSIAARCISAAAPQLPPRRTPTETANSAVCAGCYLDVCS